MESQHWIEKDGSDVIKLVIEPTLLDIEDNRDDEDVVQPEEHRSQSLPR